MELFLQFAMQGLFLGSIYALIALGYTMVYGVLRLINFAHGDVFMLGAMLSIYFCKWTGLGAQPSWWSLMLVLIMAMAACGLIGAVIERVAYRPLRNAPRLSLLITAIGVSLLIEYGGQLVFSPDPQVFPELIVTKRWVIAGNLAVSNLEVLVFVVAILLMVGLHLIVHHTRMGLAMRAVSFNFQAASLMGVNVNRVIAFTFVLGSALAGAAGVLYGLTYSSVDPLTGFMPGIKAFVAAVLGGIGSMPGALLGGFLLGEAEALTAGYAKTLTGGLIGSEYKDAIAFVILIVVLLVRPGGLLGKRQVEKV